MIIAFISFFGLIISGALKMEYYMDYMRIIDPEKMKGIETFKQVQLKLSEIDPTLSGAIFLPVFRRRNTEKEKQDENARAIAKKVINSIIIFWIFALFIILSFIGLTYL